MRNYITSSKDSDGETSVRDETLQSTQSDGVTQPQRIHVARRLPNGEVPTAKNTLRAFESSSYPTPVTAATAVPSSDKPSDEVHADLVSDTEDFTDTTISNEVLDAVAAPILEEAEAILYEADIPAQPPEVDRHTSKDERIVSEKRFIRSTYLWWIVAGTILLVTGIVAGAVGVFCASGRCRRNSSTKASGEGEVFVRTSAPTPSLNNITMIPTMEPILPSPILQSQDPTVAPTSIDTKRADIYTVFVQGITYSHQTFQNKDNGTAEERALNWIVTSDPILRTSTLESASDQFRFRQRYSLLTLYFQQETTLSVTPWANTSGWLTNADECTWYGIDCSEIDYGDDTGPQMAVVGIVLYKLNVSGTIPPDLALLSSLESFELFDNFLYGIIPSALSMWTNLHTFYVYENYLTGPLPSFTWPKMKYLSVTSNYLTGTLPVAISQWTHIESFNIYSNRFNGSIPETLDTWTNINTFLVRDNQFTGPLPNAIGTWTSLQYLNISNNQFSGTIPDTIGQCSSMRMFTVINNELTGTLPIGIGQFSLLLYFGVEGNRLSGPIPISVSNWSITTSLKYVGFHNNNFTGTIPNALCDNISNRNASTVMVVDCFPEVYCECCTCV